MQWSRDDTIGAIVSLIGGAILFWLTFLR